MPRISSRPAAVLASDVRPGAGSRLREEEVQKTHHQRQRSNPTRVLFRPWPSTISSTPVRAGAADAANADEHLRPERVPGQNPSSRWRTVGYREGGNHAWPQAGGRVQRILSCFTRRLEEAAEAQERSAKCKYQQMTRSGRDPLHARRHRKTNAGSFWVQFPNSTIRSRRAAIPANGRRKVLGDSGIQGWRVLLPRQRRVPGGRQPAERADGPVPAVQPRR